MSRCWLKTGSSGKQAQAGRTTSQPLGSALQTSLIDRLRFSSSILALSLFPRLRQRSDTVSSREIRHQKYHVSFTRPVTVARDMSASKASHHCPDNSLETAMKNTDDFFQIISDRLDKASLKLLIFGNLLSLVLRGPVLSLNQIWFNCFLLAHMLLHRYCKPLQ